MKGWSVAALAICCLAGMNNCSGGGQNPNADVDALTADANDPADFFVPDTNKNDSKADQHPPEELPRFDAQDIWVPDAGPDIDPDTGTPDIVDVSEPDKLDPEDADLPDPSGLTVADVQKSDASKVCEVPFGAMLVNVGVTIETAVVTAPAYPYQVVGNLVGFYVQDAQGGPYSGMLAVFGADQLPNLVPGAKVQLYGNHKENQCETTFVVAGLTVQDFQGVAPEPYVTTTAEIMADPEGFEGVFVKLENVQVLDANPDSGDGFDYNQFLISDGMRVGNDYKVPYMTPPNDARKAGDVFNFIVGIVKQSHGKWVVMPRSHMDMWLSGTSFPEEEPEVVIGPEPEPEPDIAEPDIVEDTYVPPDVPDVVEIEEVEPEIVPEITIPDVTDEVVVPANPDTTVVITEIMVNPAGVADSKGEWIEVYNTTDEPININGWRFTATDGNSIWFMGTLWLPPHDYFVFAANKVPAENGGMEADFDYAEVDWDLNDTADTIVLRNMLGQVVDTLAYDINALWPLVQGASVQLIHPNLENSTSTYWRLSKLPYGNGSNKGSPGAGYNNP